MKLSIISKFVTIALSLKNDVEADCKLLHKGLGHTVLGSTGVNLCMVLYLTFRGMCSCIVVKKLKTPSIVRHGNLLTVVTVRHFGL